MRFQTRRIHHRHHFLCQTTAGKIQRAMTILHMAFIDQKKAFDLIARDFLFIVLERAGYLPKLLSLLKCFDTRMMGRKRYACETSGQFLVNRGVRCQGCVLVPTLLGISLLCTPVCIYRFRWTRCIHIDILTETSSHLVVSKPSR